MNDLSHGRLACALVCGLFAVSAKAHDAWVEPAPDGSFAVVFGHAGKLEPVPASKVQRVLALDNSGRSLPVRQHPGEGIVRVAVEGKPSLLLLHYDNGFWSRTTEGLKNLPKNEVPGAVSASHAMKYGKTVLVWDAQALKSHALPVEIVPLAAPVAGIALPLQVFWDGKPLAHAALAWGEAGREVEGKTDAQGRASVPVAKGRQMVSVSARRPLANDPRAEVLSVSSNLVFDAR